VVLTGTGDSRSTPTLAVAVMVVGMSGFNGVVALETVSSEDPLHFTDIVGSHFFGFRFALCQDPDAHDPLLILLLLLLLWDVPGGKLYLKKGRTGEPPPALEVDTAVVATTHALEGHGEASESDEGSFFEGDAAMDGGEGHVCDKRERFRVLTI